MVRHGSKSGFWNMNPVTPNLPSPACGGGLGGRASDRVICPPVGLTRPAIALSKVDLPQPLGPSSETNSPRRTVRLRLAIASTPPKRTVRSAIESAGLDGAIGAASSRSVKTIAFMASLAR